MDPLPHNRPRRPSFLATAREAVSYCRPVPGRSIPSVEVNPAPNGAPVLVLPGLLRSDRQTVTLRAMLHRHGIRAGGWGLGVDWGPFPALMEGAARRLHGLADAHGPVDLVGISMGGLFCRWLALEYPDRVRQVVTICSPFRNAPDSCFLPLRPLLRHWPQDTLLTLATRVEQTLPQPTTFLYSQQDGIVAWESCIDPAQPDRCVPIQGGHVTAATDPAVWAELLRRLGGSIPG